jgi:nucleoside-triphosphatase THEP1
LTIALPRPAGLGRGRDNAFFEECHMKLAYIMSPSRGGTDPLLAEVARQLKLRGLRLCGTVQVNTEREGSQHCDMDLMVLPDGPAFRISQNRGNWARGCRLDAGSLETAVDNVARSVDHGTDLMIINKFGKHEAKGRGFRSVIAAALDRETPVLVGLNALNREAFDKFSGGLATELSGELASILEWADQSGLGAMQSTDFGTQCAFS